MAAPRSRGHARGRAAALAQRLVHGRRRQPRVAGQPEEQMRFQTEWPSGLKRLQNFAPPPQPVALVSSPLIKDSNKAKVAPLLVRFVQELRQRYPKFDVWNYAGHGGGTFHNRGFSLDLAIPGRDERGFYPPTERSGSCVPCTRSRIGWAGVACPLQRLHGRGRAEPGDRRRARVLHGHRPTQRRQGGDGAELARASPADPALSSRSRTVGSGLRITDPARSPARTDPFDAPSEVTTSRRRWGWRPGSGTCRCDPRRSERRSRRSPTVG